MAPTHGGAESPDLTWQGAERITVYCRTDSPELEQRDLCRRVEALAAEQSPLPVRALAPGDPDLLAPRSVALLADFASQDGAAGPLLIFTLRLYRHGGEPVLFGSRPRAAPLTADGASGALDRELRAALSEILPRRGPTRPAGRP
ncbi:hypothetical protein [Phenylobacterium sp.]|jgi:hypothetical protein|uniref:hypothetical protein n=1 Tax=Phenylobacterium sp. TaxID=1871053 RepID=UPI002E2F719B|nr:hypothetical protein [Phenylobacterium sp.]HEX2560111.1 hypothetical protein [Phenylobacterium sp.]